MVKRVQTFVCLLAFLTFQSASFAQGPGGIGTNLKLWLKADAGTTVSGSTLSQWNDLSGAGVTGNFSAQTIGTLPTQTSPSYAPVAINFNPYVSFNGLSNSMTSGNSFLGSNVWATNDNSIFQVIRYHSGGVWFKWENNSGGNIRVGFESNGSFIRGDFPCAIPTTGINNLSTVNIVNSHRLVTFQTDVTNSTFRLDGLVNGIQNISSAGAFQGSTFTDQMILGNNRSFNLPTNIEIAEVISFNVKLTAADVNRVESYLAIKYGFTLNQTTPQNYVSSNSTIVWDATANLTYNKDITGIGRDDNGTQNQKQSRNNTLADLVTVGLGSIVASNVANTSTFTNDQSFLTWGHNGLTATFGSNNVPQGLGFRFNRVWKEQVTNFSQAVTLGFETSLLPPGANVNNIRLLLDDDGNFSNAKVISGGIVNGTRLEFPGQTFDNFSKPYFSLAVCNTSPPVLTYTPVCPGEPLTIVSNPTYTDPTSVFSWTGPNSYTTANDSVILASLTTSALGSYSLVLSANTCTLTTGTVNVAYSNTLTADAGLNDTINCVSPSTVTLNGTTNGSGVTYSWTGPNSFSSSAAQPVVSDNGMYYLQVTKSSCTAKDSVRIFVDTIHPVISAIPGGTITCINGTLIGPAVVTPTNVSYSWTGPGSFVSSVAQPSVNTSGTYSLTVTTTTNGCTADGTVFVAADTAKPALTVAPIDTVGCNTPVVIGPQTVDPTLNYSWTGSNAFSSTAPNPSIGVVGTYTLVATSQINGCVSTYTVGTILNNTLTLTFAPPAFSVCPGYSATITPSGAASYDVDPGGYTVTGPFVLQPSTTTTYTITGTLGLCTVIDSITGVVYPQPTAGFSTNYVNEADFDGNLETTDLSTGAVLWSWNFGDGTPIDNLQAPEHKYDIFVPVTYTITQIVTSADGCIDSTHQTITVSPVATLYVPNAFTPNGDGVNDLFGAQGIGVKSFEMWIYDRWGQVVFHANDLNDHWDGQYKGTVVEQGTFSYKIISRDIYDKLITKVGMVVVLPQKKN